MCRSVLSTTISPVASDDAIAPDAMDTRAVATVRSAPRRARALDGSDD